MDTEEEEEEEEEEEDSGHAVAQLTEALRYKPENRGFFSRWCHRNASLMLCVRIAGISHSYS